MSPKNQYGPGQMWRSGSGKKLMVMVSCVTMSIHVQWCLPGVVQSTMAKTAKPSSIMGKSFMKCFRMNSHADSSTAWLCSYFFTSP